MTSGTVEAMRVRLAQYYLDQLQMANAVYRKGHESSTTGLTLFDQDWPHIKQWHAWAASRADRDPVAARLCRDYAEMGANILGLRLTARQQIEWLETGLKVVRAQEDPRAEMWSLYRIAEVYNRQGAFDLSDAYSAQSLALARRLDEGYCVGLNIYLQGEAERLRGNYASAGSLFTEGLAILRGLRVLHDVGRAYRGLGLVAWHHGNFEEARDYHNKHLTIATELGANTEVCDALLNLSLSIWVLGDQSALEYLDRCIALCRITGYQRTLASALNTLGQFLQEMGLLEDARRQFEEGLSITREHGYLMDTAAYQANLGDALSAMGDYTGALANLSEATTLAREHGWRRHLANNLSSSVTVFAAIGDFDGARRSLREAVAIAIDLHNWILNLHVIISGIDLLYATGETVKAAEWAGSLLNLPRLPDGERAYITSLCAKLVAVLGQESFAHAQERGRSYDLDMLIQVIAQDSEALFQPDSPLPSSKSTHLN